MDNTRRIGVPHVAAWAAVGPLLLPFAATLWIIVGWAIGTDPFWPTPVLNVAEAAAVRDHAEVVRLIQQGEDPNRRWPVRIDLLDSQAHMMTPLEAAIEIRRLELVQLLIKHGAQVTPENRPSLVDRAKDGGATDIVEFLETAH